MNETLPTIRRIVTGDDPSGKSRIVEDAPAIAVRAVAERPGYRSVNLWRTMRNPASIDDPDSISKHEGILPPAQGSILRIIDFPPEPANPAERIRACTAPKPSITRSFWKAKSGR